MEALKQAGAPEARPAWNPFDITILFKVGFADIIAKRESAVKAEWEPVPEYTLPERAGALIVPDIINVPTVQAADNPRFHTLFDSANIAVVAVPEEVAGMYIAVP